MPPVLSRAMRLLAVLALALALAGCGGDAATVDETTQATTSTDESPETTPTASTTTATTEAGATGGFAQIPDVVSRVSPSVVAILTSGNGGLAQGSGVIWSSDGIIVTNHHVIADADAVQVAFASGRRIDAEVEASDPGTDLALLRVDTDPLPAATFARDLPRVGELAIAIGTPLGLENTVTAGVVSGVHRSVPFGDSASLTDLLQTDAAISPGNSGGALVDGDGEVIGINVAYVPPEARAVSLGFAIPSPTVIDVVEQLLEDGTVEHAFLGIQPAPITPELAEQFELTVDQGTIVLDVVPDTAAERAGVEPGDVITAIDDDPVRRVEDLFAALRRHGPGDVVTVTVVRDGEQIELEVELGAAP